MLDNNKDAEEFWRDLSVPTDRGCFNCANRGQGDSPLTCNRYNEEECFGWLLPCDSGNSYDDVKDNDDTTPILKHWEWDGIGHG